MHRVIVFDFDGVLADTLGDMLRHAQEACSQLGHSCQPTQRDLDALEHMSFDEFGRQLGVPEGRVKEFTRHCLELFASSQHPPGIFDGMYDAIVRFSARSKIGIVTGSTSEVVWDFLDRRGLAEHVDIVLDVNDAGSRSDKILKVADSIGEPGSEIYMVGDAVSDIRAARQASVKSVAVTWGHQSRDKLAKERPDYLMHSPRGLVRLLCEDSPPLECCCYTDGGPRL